MRAYLDGGDYDEPQPMSGHSSVVREHQQVGKKRGRHKRIGFSTQKPKRKGKGKR